MPLFDHIKTMLAAGHLNVSKRFALLHEAISGTMSNFYMARDLNTGKVVGLKILDPKKTAAFEARFKGLDKPSEGEIAVQLKHPSIVETIEYGVTNEGAQYLVMEYLDGPNLNMVLAARDPVLDGRRVHFIRQAAEALAAVHEAGFIHRDVCPRNFLLCNGREDIKLIDFGLTVPATRWFMQPGNRTGTPNYMAPELVRRRPTDQRLDIFAFGVTAYEFCTFELPWPRGSTGMAAMSHDQPPADIRKYRPEINPRLAKAIHACIEPNREKRCPTMADFLRMIRGLSED
ncbi:MAG: serine/threonine protein kinase [Pirellulales bacterium]|nr:serine/threonine protein kinase [Pirellulales bacterium]